MARFSLRVELHPHLKEGNECTITEQTRRTANAAKTGRTQRSKEAEMAVPVTVNCSLDVEPMYSLWDKLLSVLVVFLRSRDADA